MNVNGPIPLLNKSGGWTGAHPFRGSKATIENTESPFPNLIGGSGEWATFVGYQVRPSRLHDVKAERL